MSTVGNMFPTGGGQGRLLPSIKSAADLISRIRDDLDVIERKVNAIIPKLNSLSTAQVSASLAGGQTSGGGAAASAAGMPTPTFSGLQVQPGSWHPSPQQGASQPWTPGQSQPSQGGGDGGDGLRARMGRAAGGFGFAMASAAWAHNTQRTAELTDRSLLYNRLLIMDGQNGGTRSEGRMAQQLRSGYKDGFDSPDDLIRGLSTALAGGIDSRSILDKDFQQSAVGLTQSTGYSLQDLMQTQGSMIANSEGMAKGRAFGINVTDPRTGAARPMDKVLQEVAQATGAQGMSREQLEIELSPYGGLNKTMKGLLGFSEEEVSRYGRMFKAQADSGTPIDFGNAKFNEALKSAGYTDLMQTSLKKQAAGEERVITSQYDGMREAAAQTAEAMGQFNSAIGRVTDNLLGDVLGALRGFSGQVGSLSGGGPNVIGSAVGSGLGVLGAASLLAGGKGGAGIVRTVGGKLLGGLRGAAGSNAVKAGSRAALNPTVLRGAAAVGAPVAAWKLTNKADEDTFAGKSAVVGGWTAGGAAAGTAIMPGLGTLAGVGVGALTGTVDAWTDWWDGGGNSQKQVDREKSHLAQWAPHIRDSIQQITSRWGIRATTYNGHSPSKELATDLWPNNRQHGDQIAEWLRANAAALNIEYVIWWQRIWNTKRSSEGWRKMGDRGSKTANHFDHLHVSYLPSGKGSKASSSGGTFPRDGDTASADDSRNGPSGAASAMASALAAVGATGDLSRLARELTGDTSGGTASPTSTGGAPSAPSDSKGNVAIGQRMAAQRGWTGAEWDALYQLWQKESNWNHTADNPRSSAYGIPQALIALHKMPKGYVDRTSGTGANTQGYGGNPEVQIKWGLDYISGRYGTPSKALGHHKRVNWYEKGAFSIEKDGETAVLHKDEMVLPKPIADSVREKLNSGGGGTTTSTVGGSRTVNVNLTLNGADEIQAMKFAKMVKRLLDDEADLDTIGET